jgi:hypothetical protein
VELSAHSSKVKNETKEQREQRMSSMQRRVQNPKKEG